MTPSQAKACHPCLGLPLAHGVKEGDQDSGPGGAQRVSEGHGTAPHILWIATLTNGLNKFDKQTETFTRYGYDPNNANNLNFPEVWRIVEDRSDPNILWLSSVGGGLVKFEKEAEIFTHYTHDPNNPHGLH